MIKPAVAAAKKLGNKMKSSKAAGVAAGAAGVGMLTYIGQSRKREKAKFDEVMNQMGSAEAATNELAKGKLPIFIKKTDQGANIIVSDKDTKRHAILNKYGKSTKDDGMLVYHLNAEEVKRVTPALRAS
jgi:predicted house-cleaning NTP pyrophosphatase (Maf/HAM1 superfamily)